MFRALLIAALCSAPFMSRAHHSNALSFREAVLADGRIVRQRSPREAFAR